MERARLAKQWVTSITPTASRAALVVSQIYRSLVKWLPFVIYIPSATSSCLLPQAKFPCKAPASEVVFYLPSVSVQWYFLKQQPRKVVFGCFKGCIYKMASTWPLQALRTLDHLCLWNCNVHLSFLQKTDKICAAKPIFSLTFYLQMQLQSMMYICRFCVHIMLKNCSLMFECDKNKQKLHAETP